MGCLAKRARVPRRVLDVCIAAALLAAATAAAQESRPAPAPSTERLETLPRAGGAAAHDAPAAAPAGRGPVAPAPAGGAQRAPDLANGERVYREGCVACHGPTGEGGLGGGTPLAGTRLAREDIVAITANGRGNMPPLGGAYSTDTLRDVAAFIVERLTPPPR